MSEAADGDSADNTTSSSIAPAAGPLTVVLPDAPPTLSPTAAAILLRILREAAEQQQASCPTEAPDPGPTSDLPDEAN
jgi:hypothetical protein